MKLKQDCEGNVCPMPLKSVAGTIKGLKLINYDEKTEIAEFEYPWLDWLEKTFAWKRFNRSAKEINSSGFDSQIENDGGGKHEAKFGQNGQDFKICAGVLVAWPLGSKL